VIALCGGEIWSLVASSIASAIMNVALLWKMSDWRPKWEFSWISFRELFSFGGLLALSNVVERFFANIQGVIIGKWYSATDMGYYSQAYKLEQIPNQTLSQIVSQVSFPLFSELQDDITRLRKGVRKNIKALVFLNFPLCCLLIIVATPLIHILYGYKWDVSIPYFQILCVGGLFYSVNSMNMNIIKALGKGKVYLFAQIAKRIFCLIMMIGGAIIGIKGLLWGIVISRLFNFLLNAFLNKRYINYGVIEQITDVGGTLIITAIVGVIVFAIGYLPLNQYVIFFLQLLMFVVIYLKVSSLLKIEELYTYRTILGNLLHKIRVKST
jgi:O-antigen/teichoic acid export membrane protein